MRHGSATTRQETKQQSSNRWKPVVQHQRKRSRSHLSEKGYGQRVLGCERILLIDYLKAKTITHEYYSTFLTWIEERKSNLSPGTTHQCTRCVDDGKNCGIWGTICSAPSLFS
ncbi:hypothetical protein CDAR_96241 [Caerostris darwini]|uniref:Uncharacterized protein n=1 Tax=Caerostris darwini TaxID=1538125 RepID=A0AAV4RCL4_9ARAC|nr:hypothetical protein CDAR_96241 [Caerostris darwini]